MCVPKRDPSIPKRKNNKVTKSNNKSTRIPSNSGYKRKQFRYARHAQTAAKKMGLSASGGSALQFLRDYCHMHHLLFLDIVKSQKGNGTLKNVLQFLSITAHKAILSNWAFQYSHLPI